MVAYSLKTQAAVSVFTVSDMGTITNESVNKESNLFFTSLPRQDSSLSIALDIMGATKSITLTGKFTAADGTIATFITELQALVDGTQPTLTLVSSRSGLSTKVKVQTVDWSCTEAEFGIVNFSMVLVECAVVD